SLVSRATATPGWTPGTRFRTGELRQQGVQRGAFLRAQGLDQVGLMGGRDLHDPIEQRPPGFGQVQSADAAITRLGPTLEQPAPFEFIDERDDPARRDAHRLAERLLRAALLGRDLAEQRDLS